MIGILPILTKDYLLSYVTQEQIFEKYLNITVQTDSLFKSPPQLRTTDDNPSCGFKYNINGKLRLKDFQGNFHGDCFDLVGRLIGVNACNKVGFNVVLDNIAKIFNLHKYSIGTYSNPDLELDEDYFKKIKTKSLIEVRIKDWDKYDLEYWKKFNIELKHFPYFRVYALDRIWLNKEHNYSWRINDPAYGYYFGNNEWKIYFPVRKDNRFLSNTSVLQGKNLLTCGKACIITKAYKDVMSLKTFGIDAVAPSSESQLISKEDYNFIKYRYNHIFSLMDYDNTGIRMSRKLEKVYNIIPLYFTDKLWNRKRGIQRQKDFTDYNERFGSKETMKLIQQTLDKYESMFDEYDLYTHNQLNWIK